MTIGWHIGDVIAKLRKAAKMNQTVFAAKVGVNKATIVRAEDGDVKVSRETYLKIAHVLRTDIAALEAEAARLQAVHPVQVRQSMSEGGTRAASATDAVARDSATRTYIRDGAQSAAGGQQPGGPRDPVSGASRAEIRRVAADLLSLADEAEQAHVLERPATAARAARQHAATTRAHAPVHRAAPRKRRR